MVIKISLSAPCARRCLQFGGYAVCIYGSATTLIQAYLHAQRVFPTKQWHLVNAPLNKNDLYLY